MKCIIKWVLPCVGVLFLTACSSTEKGEGEPESAQKQHQPLPSSSASPVPRASQTIRIKDDALNAIYQQYVVLNTALTNGAFAEAKFASNAIEAGTRGVKEGAALAAAAAKITAASNIEVQRTAFSALSQELIALVKKSGLNSGVIYVDYCPMALADEGAYWLSSQKEIRNPYFGDQMLTCGEVKERIP